ncbi:hypothetical protein V1506DRAFT_535187 [Lipomyces tetrasporus]
MSSRTRSRSPDMRARDRDRHWERHGDRDKDRERYSSRHHSSSDRHQASSKGHHDSASSSHGYRSSKYESSYQSLDRNRDRDRDRDRESYRHRDSNREHIFSERARDRDREYRSRDRYTRRDRDRDERDNVKDRVPARRPQSPTTDLERKILLTEDQESDIDKHLPTEEPANSDDNPDAIDAEEEEQRKERERRERDARAQALTLEIIGDLPYAEVKPPENVLFVCKLNPITEDEDLHTFFSQCGKIVSCEVIRDKKTGNSLQYAFIEYERKQDCENAYLKMQGALIDDCRIHVDFSQSVAKLSNMWRTATNHRRALEARETAQKPKRRWRD